MSDTIKILYEDEDFLAVNKPSGLVVHSDGRTKESTVADWVLEKYPALVEVGEPWVNPSGVSIPRPGIVHRLDRDTSGVLLIAKTQPAFEYFKKQFQERNIKKAYRAFVHGIIKEEKGTISKPIGRSTADFRKWSAEYGARGELREAVTDFFVLARGNDSTYVEVYPKTGRTHQIRVHMKAIGHPLVCDSLYAPKSPNILGFSRLALHSFSIDLTTPKEKILHIEAPLPADFEKGADFLKNLA